MTAPLYDRDGMARMIRTFFIEHKSSGRKYKPNPRHDNWENWLKAADACIAAGANPKDWVDASFAMAPATVFANQLGGAAALARWRSFTNKEPNPLTEVRVPEEIAEQAQQPVANVISDSELMEDTKAEILTVLLWFKNLTGNANPATNRETMLNQFNATILRPHIRVALAGKAGMIDVVVKFREDAIHFLSTRPHHMQCLLDLQYDMKTYLYGN
jgi:hypothetical protein